MATNKDFIVKNGLQVGGDIVVTGSLQTAGLTLPASDGTSGQVIATDGSGNLSFQSIVSNFTISDGTNTDTFNTGETLTFTAGTGITTTVSNNVVTISGVAQYTDADAIAAVEGATHLTIDGGTLYVDTANNYVGIGDTSPQHKLDVAGGIGINGNEVITSAGTYTGPVLDGSLTVGGSLVGPLSDAKVQYGTAYSGTPAQGSFFFDSLNQKLKVYTGSSFVDAVPAGAGGGGGDLTDAVATFEKFQYTVSSQTNAISGSDDNSNTLAYVVDGSQNVEVYVNGVKQYEGATNDYVATTGTSVTFTYNIPSGSVVDIQVYELLTNDAFYLKTETYTQAETNSQIATGLSSYLPLAGGTLTGDLQVNSDSLKLNNADNNNNTYFFAENTGAGNAGLKLKNAQGEWTIIANDRLRFIDDDAGLERLSVLSSGNVGIGTTSPTHTLDVQSSLAVPLRLRSTNTAGTGLYLDNNRTGSKTFGILVGNTGAGDFNIKDEDAGVNRLIIKSDGNTLLGTTHNSDQALRILHGSSGRGWGIKLDDDESNSTFQYIEFLSGGSSSTAGSPRGSIVGTSSGTTYNTTSDRRLKDNITTITNGKEKLLAMNPVTHTWKADSNTGETVHGFIAQEMQEIVPEAVSGDPDSDEMMSMDYGRITPVIVAALQDALNEIKELKERINELENK